MSSRSLCSAVVALTLLLLVHETHAAVGETCKCRSIQDATCLKTTEVIPRDATDGLKVWSCRKEPCETWKCDEIVGTVTCIERALEYILINQGGYGQCSVSRPEGRTFLTPYTADDGQDNRPFRRKPERFSMKFAANEKCWVFHGETHLLDTDDPHQVNTIAALPVGNCEPFKIKCADTKVRLNQFEGSSVTGPVIVMSFQADGAIHGVGLERDSDEAISSKNTSAKFWTAAYTPARLVRDEGFKANVAGSGQTKTVFRKFPTWQPEFKANGKLIAKPLIVSTPYDTNQMATFVITPPYCNYPYRQEY